MEAAQHLLNVTTDNVRVLNAASGVTLQRTIVEAFVKLVVCRKITVQNVSAASGKILDSHTTQEEDMPVILNVHRQETGNVQKAMSSDCTVSTISSFDQSHLNPPTMSAGLAGKHTDNKTNVNSCAKDGYSEVNRDLSSSLAAVTHTLSLSETCVVTNSMASDTKVSNQTKPMSQNHQLDKRISSTLLQENIASPRKRMKLTKIADPATRLSDYVGVVGSSDSVLTASSEGRLVAVNVVGEALSETVLDYTSIGENIVVERGKINGDENPTLENQLTGERKISYEQDISLSSLSYFSDQRPKNEDSCENVAMGNSKDGSSEQIFEQCETEEAEDDTTGQDVSNIPSDHDHGLKSSNNYDAVIEGEHFCEDNAAVLVVTSTRSLMSDLDVMCPNGVRRPSGDGDKQGSESISNSHNLPSTMYKSGADSDPSITPNQEKMGDQAPVITNIAENVAVTCPELSLDVQDAQSESGNEPPDPFAHLLEGFFPPKRMYDNANSANEPHQSGADTNRNKKNSQPVMIKVKEEPDDDCMITAAFMTASGPKKVATQGSRTQKISNSVKSVWGGGQSVTDHQRMQGVWDQRQDVGAFNFSGRLIPTTCQTASHSTCVSSSTAYPPNFLSSGAAQHSASVPTDSGPSAMGDRLLPSLPSAAVDYSYSLGHSSSSSAHVDYSQATYQCPLCSKIFLHRYKFDLHAAMCGGQRPFKCRLCSKGFNQRAHLDTHLKFHQGDKPYRCDICRKAYVMKGDLIRHLKTRLHLDAMSNNRGAAPSCLDPQPKEVSFHDQSQDRPSFV